MTYHSRGADLVSGILALQALAETTVTAGGGNDNADIAGVAINLMALPSRAHGIGFWVTAAGTLSGGQTAEIFATIEHSDDGTVWVTHTPRASIGILTASGVRVFGVHASVDRTKQYVRITPRANPSAANTDTVKLSATFMAGSFERALG